VLPAFELSRPATLDEAARHIAAGGVPYAGGTELVAAMNMGLIEPPHLVDLKRVDGLRGITAAGGRMTIGAATRHDEVAGSAAVQEHAPMLATACTMLGNMRVRATGSIGGNICFADPRSDVTTALFALDARVSLYSSGGRRTVPIGDFVLGALESDCSDGELLEAVHIPIEDRHQVYLRHQPAEYPTVCVALSVPRSRPDAPVRLVVGAVGERPQVFDAPSVDDIGLETLLPRLDVIEDLNGSEEYKRHLAGVFIGRAVATLKEGTDA
jgi:carbon-monoxide dehydrogenase medium subunit